jgi:predicted nucleic acid-binding protein
MTFTVLPAGATVFLDANTLLYHFAADPKYADPCTDLIERIERQELTGFSSTAVISEVAQRMMTIEAVDQFGRPFAGIVGWLQKHPTSVQQLTRFRQAIREVPRYRIQILTILPDLLDAAAAVTQQTGLLHNDSLIVALMELHGLTNLASADTDFDRVPRITRFAPVSGCSHPCQMRSGAVKWPKQRLMTPVSPIGFPFTGHTKGDNDAHRCSRHQECRRLGHAARDDEYLRDSIQ